MLRIQYLLVLRSISVNSQTHFSNSRAVSFQHPLIELATIHPFVMVHKLTEEYANHGMSLKCDIYTGSDYPKDAPVFLYFHPGGLVDGNRQLIAPWLVQVGRKKREGIQETLRKKKHTY